MYGAAIAASTDNYNPSKYFSNMAAAFLKLGK
jgi:hypothetical protein